MNLASDIDLDFDLPVGLVAIIVALVAAGVLSVVETAITGMSQARVDNLLKEETPGAPRLQKIMDRRSELVNLLVLLRTISEVTGAAVTTSLAIGLWGLHPHIITVAVILVTIFTFVVIGVLSRTLGRQNPYAISRASAPLLLAVAWLLSPIARILVWAGNLITPGGGFRDGPFSTEIEIREMVDIASAQGVVENDERKMIQSVFDLASTSARSVMVPRPEMVWIESTKHAGQATSLCVRTGLSRLPVVGEDVDDIVGVVYLKDLVKRTYSSSDNGHSVGVAEVMRPAVFVPDSKKLDVLLEDMQRDQIHIAMLVDEYGAIAGLISIEDILEEIVGEISDEYDAVDIAPIEELADGSFRVQARVSISEVEEAFNEQYAALNDQPASAQHIVAFSEEQHAEVDTVGGLGAYELGRVPIPGAEVTTAGLHFRFEGGRDRRGRPKIRSAVITRLSVEDDDAAAATETPAAATAEGEELPAAPAQALNAAAPSDLTLSPLDPTGKTS